MSTPAAATMVFRLVATVSITTEPITSALALGAKTMAKAPDLTTSVVECGTCVAQALLAAL
ncbi:hypothetical protein SLEP1_g40049 [Rubroshorea leprosula]|uniref:Uncharacterized protein n=1 Tax=Rubroshorea leprosula TaxID=152421 RepID=A0AAV5L2L7_9ROSI|nr:hypothetical protein SLEP1_g40049 [Rubroshorea leprosula]